MALLACLVHSLSLWDDFASASMTLIATLYFLRNLPMDPIS
jgi:hypothetical protein